MFSRKIRLQFIVIFNKIIVNILYFHEFINILNSKIPYEFLKC